jgi:hypothetical protein
LTVVLTGAPSEDGERAHDRGAARSTIAENIGVFRRRSRPTEVFRSGGHASGCGFGGKGWHEGKADVSAEQAAPEKGTRVSGENELEEWPTGAEEATGEGTQASYCQQRVARHRRVLQRSGPRRAGASPGPWRKGCEGALADERFEGWVVRTFNKFTGRASGFTAAIVRYSSCPTTRGWDALGSRRRRSWAAPSGEIALNDSYERFFAVTRSHQASTSSSYRGGSCSKPA